MTRSKLILIGLLAALPVFGVTALVQAHDGHSHDSSTVREGQVVNRTHFSSGRDVTMAGEVDGDMFCAGQTVTISGRVKGDVICAGQTVRISGTVDGDVRLAAQTATIEGTVGGSLSVAAENARLERDASVARDFSVVATGLMSAGTVGRDLYVTADTATVDGPVARDVGGQTDRLILAGGARVGGAVSYVSDRDLQRDAGAEVGGRVSRQIPERQEDSGAAVWGPIRLFGAVSLLLTALFLVLLVPGVFHAVAGRARRSLGLTVLTGLIAAIVAPVLIIALMLTVVGIPLGLFLLAVWLVLLFLSGPFAAYLAGRLVLRDSTNAVVIMLTGALLLVVLYQIPIINVLTMVAVVWFGVGMILRSLWRLRRRPQYDMAPADDMDISQRPGAPTVEGVTDGEVEPAPAAPKRRSKTPKS